MIPLTTILTIAALGFSLYMSLWYMPRVLRPRVLRGLRLALGVEVLVNDELFDLYAKEGQV